MLDFIRGMVRPFITATGWLALLVYVGKLVWDFADKPMADTMVQALLTAIAVIVGFWFSDRLIRRNGE